MKGVTFSKNVFLPLTNYCHNHCSYCNFRRQPDKAEIMDLEEVVSLLQQAKSAGCTEALFTLGSRPHKVEGFTDSLKSKTGYEDIYNFLIDACKKALEIGILPHSNVGVVSKEVLSTLRKYNASLGLMLETTAELPSHRLSPTKEPSVRLEFIALAGKLWIPFTTGLLLGIGETDQDIIESLYKLRKLHENYGHLQEVILQPVKGSRGFTSPDLTDLKVVVSLARDILPEEIAIQVPPNLEKVDELIQYGVSDLGGISPITIDYINPDYSWPRVDELKNKLNPYQLKERLPVYQRYIKKDWITKPIRDCMEREEWI